MTAYLGIGIASSEVALALATSESGRPSIEVSFPATEIGVQAIKILLASCRGPVRLAVSGAGALGLALSFGNVPGRQAFIVSSAVAGRPVALARYAVQTP